MKKQEFKSVEQVWDVIKSGQKVYWGNKSYQVIEQTDADGKSFLRVTCMSNWFGSRLETSELGQLFTDGDEK